jgi:hypothetical protein
MTLACDLSSWQLNLPHLFRYIPFIFPGAALDRTANNCLFIGYFLVVLYTATSSVWILALRPVILDLPAARPQASRSAAAKIDYLKVKEDSAGNWFQGRSISSISTRSNQKPTKKPPTPAACGTDDARQPWKASNIRSDSKEKVGVPFETGNSLLGNCCGGRRNDNTQSMDQTCHEPCCGADESQRHVNFLKDAHAMRTPRGEDAAPAVLASSVLVRRSASHPLPAHHEQIPPDDYISRALARSSAAIGWGTAHNSPRIPGAE